MFNAGFEIGSHSHSHEWLSQLSDDEALSNLSNSVNILRNIGVKGKDIYVDANVQLLRHPERIFLGDTKNTIHVRCSTI